MDEKLNDLVVIVIDKGIVKEAYSDNADQRIVIVDLDNRRIDEDSVTEFYWPETQMDENRVRELIRGSNE